MKGYFENMEDRANELQHACERIAYAYVHFCNAASLNDKHAREFFADLYLSRVDFYALYFDIDPYKLIEIATAGYAESVQ